MSLICVQIKALAGSAMNPRHFGFIDPPPSDGLEAAIIYLKQHLASAAKLKVVAVPFLLALARV
eukprot:scaffold203185_cov20-Tisochrysis_lutea.AAC.1